MRVGIVSNLRGGLKQFAVNLCGGLMEKGFDVEILCPAHLTASEVSEMYFDLPIYMGPPAVARLFANRYDLVHYNIAVLGLFPIFRRMLDRLPLIQTFHGIPLWNAEPRIIDKTRYAMEHNVTRLTARSDWSRISVSVFVRSVIHEWLGIDSSVIYHGIRHYRTLNSRNEARKQLGIEDESVAILFVGRLHPYKDPITLLRAVARLVKEGRDVKLFVVGDGPLSTRFHTSVMELGLQGLVTIWSWVSTPFLHSIYSAADIFCLPSVNEAFGVVLLEAMDHSIPLVVSNSGALPEVVSGAGLKFTTGDEIDLSHKLLRLVDDRVLRRTLGQMGRTRFESQFSLETMIQKYVRAYEEAVE